MENPSSSQPEFKYEIKEVEKDGKKVSQVTLPFEFEGYSFLMLYSKDGMSNTDKGPYKIELILCNDFIIYDLDFKLEGIKEGYSNLKPGTSQIQFQKANLVYFSKSGDSKKAVLSFNVKEGTIRSLIIIFSDEPLEAVVPLALKLLNPLLDAITFVKMVPLKICRIHLYHVPSNYLLREYTTLPYHYIHNLEPDTIKFAMNIPNSLKPVIRLYRESKNSNNSQYRFLSLFKACEEIIKIRNQNSQAAKQNNLKTSRKRVTVPDNTYSRTFFEENIGNNFDGFVNDTLRRKYRDNIAHLNFDSKLRIILDPSETLISGSASELDGAIRILDHILHEVVENEIEYMTLNKL
jgi:hypothetical protein